MDDTSGAEQRLAEQGVAIQDDQWPDCARPEHTGFAKIAELGGDGLMVWLLVRPDSDSQARAAFAEWAESRIDRFVEHGPGPDGWHWVEADGSWQMWVRPMELPEW
ncbi:hypothetical protein ACFXPT_11265 [Streptomyces goshikiensis]|uniref:hypothetical protein n=1 Tax=Streptomyces goshikiensis TaxID=1942 RepID=UPI0036D1C4E0